MVSKATINQFLANFSYGDAISNHALWIREVLRNLGYESHIYACAIEAEVAHEAGPFSGDALRSSTAAIFHYSIASDIDLHLVAYPGRKCLIYHNITPSEFFRPFSPEFELLLEQSRDSLRDIASHFPLCAAVSEYNADELRRCGFSNPIVFRIPVDRRCAALCPNENIAARLHDERTNILFVGRIAPHKKQADLILAFDQYLGFDSNARLILIGAGKSDPYGRHVQLMVHVLGLGESILLPGRVSDEELAGYYRTATLYWSMSEHEGVGVPFIEAMWFEVPILAYCSSAIGETIGEGGLLFRDKRNLANVALTAHILCHDAALRQTIVEGQRRQRVKFCEDDARIAVAELARALSGS